MADIDKLSVQITSDSTSAVSGIEALATSLGKLKTATSGGLGLGAVAKNLQAMKTSLSGMGNVANNLNGLEKAINTLKNLGGIKISSSIGNQITKINTALSGLNIGDGATKINELVTALKPLETLGKSSLGTTVNALDKLPGALSKIDTRELYNQITSLTRIFKPLADEMQKVANGFNAFPGRIQKLIANNEKLTKSNNRTSGSYTDMWAKMRMAYNTIRTGVKWIGSAINESNKYIENVNLFNVSMGAFATEARNYAEQVGDIMGVDPGEWMRNQGVFMTLATGFGVTSERANKMSKNLTQLGYDLSSFFNIPYEDAMQKLQSGLAGELEPLRRIGYDLSVARLQQEAYTLGINKKVSAMTQAEKAELRYYAIMTQVTTAQGDMARTLDAPANQLRVLKSQITQAARAIGNIFIPLLQTVLPYLIATAKAVRLVANEIAKLFGFEEITADMSGFGSLASGADDYSNALGGAADNAKKLQKYTMGFDELNVIDPNKGSDSDTGVGAGGGLDFELPEYDFLSEATNSKVNELVGKIKDDIIVIAGLVPAVAGGLLAWKFSKSFLTGLTVFTTTLGAAILIDSVVATAKEGLSWKSAIEGAVGGALMGAAIGFKLGGWQGALGGVVIGIGVSLIINGITGALADGVQVEDVASIIGGVLGTVGGIITVIKLFNKTHKSPLPDVEEAGKTISDTATGVSKMTGKLKTLTKNLGLGLVVMLEVVAAAGIFVGAIWGIGKLLDETQKAWEPVINGGGDVGLAIREGTIILVLIGAAAALLGVATTATGYALPIAIGLGMGILLEMGLAAALFLTEIKTVGELLDKIGVAWEPVLKDGEDIATSISVGTGLLIGIGTVAAALGVATVASVGLLPVAIALGTALLVEMAEAFKTFCDSLIDVAGKLEDDLAPSLEGLCEILPDLKDDMSSFTGFMTGFAEEVVKYTKVSAIAGIAATIDTIIGYFTTDPVKRMNDEVSSQIPEFEDLIESTEKINPLIDRATELMGDYHEKMGKFNEATGMGGGLLGSIGGAVKTVVNSVIGAVETMANGVIKSINFVIDGLNRLKIDVPDWVTEKFGISDFGFNIPRLQEVTIPRFETGGFPETGQMFIAREAGAEMVGSIGRRTAVANNDQIVAGIASGVAEANTESNALLREQNELLRAMLAKESGVYLDGKSLTKSVEKYQSQRGRVLVTGGAY